MKFKNKFIISVRILFFHILAALFSLPLYAPAALAD